MLPDIFKIIWNKCHQNGLVRRVFFTLISIICMILMHILTNLAFSALSRYFEVLQRMCPLRHPVHTFRKLQEQQSCLESCYNRPTSLGSGKWSFDSRARPLGELKGFKRDAASR